MVALVSIPDKSLKFMSEVRGSAQFIGDSAFDSTLQRARCPAENSTLKISLRIFLKQAAPGTIDKLVVEALAKVFGSNVAPGTGFFPDAGKKPILIKDWGAADWRKFVNGFTSQAQMWHNKFWLIPPSDFKLFDLYEGKKVFRPNVFCAFNLEIVANIAGAHRTIEVVNLSNPKDFFRSDWTHYDSADIELADKGAYDQSNHYRKNKQPTVAHEIGHAIGLPHIGVTRGLQKCDMAKVAYDYKNWVPQDWLAGIYQGGTNSSVCYGEGASVGDIDNIMGKGDKFTKENAAPWLDRLAVHLPAAFDKAKWTVSVGRVAPKDVTGLP